MNARPQRADIAPNGVPDSPHTPVIVKSAKDPTVERGSVWRRWEPHIHTPGTILNDQFDGSNVWDEYLTRIEQAAPEVQALGVAVRRNVRERTHEAHPIPRIGSSERRAASAKRPKQGL